MKDTTDKHMEATFKLTDKLCRMPVSVLDVWLGKMAQDATQGELETAIYCSAADNLNNLEHWQKASITAILIEMADWHKTLPLLVQDIDYETLQELYIEELFSSYDDLPVPETTDNPKMNYNNALEAYRESKAAINDKFDEKYPNASDNPDDFTAEEFDAFMEMYKTDENYKQCAQELIKAGDILLETDEEFKKAYEEFMGDPFSPVTDYCMAKAEAEHNEGNA